MLLLVYKYGIIIKKRCGDFNERKNSLYDCKNRNSVDGERHWLCTFYNFGIVGV